MNNKIDQAKAVVDALIKTFSDPYYGRFETIVVKRDKLQALKDLRAYVDEMEKDKAHLLEVIREAAHCVLSDQSGAIVDTIWMPHEGLIGTTLYEHLCCPLDVELTGDIPKDIEALNGGKSNEAK